MTEEVLVRVQTKLFVAGVTLLDDTCITAAPILSWCRGKSAEELRALFKTFGWIAHIVKSPIDCKVTLTRDGLLGATADERAQMERLFGKPMVESIVGGGNEMFEGEYAIEYVKPEAVPSTAQTTQTRRSQPQKRSSALQQGKTIRKNTNGRRRAHSV